MSVDFLERTLPHNLEAERSILGAVLLHNEALNDAAGRVQETHFFRRAHQCIYRHMCLLSTQGAPIDFVSLKESLSRTGDLDEVGGPAYLAALVDGVPRSANVEHYAQIVREKAHLRDVITAANKMLVRAYDAEDNAALVVEEAERQIFALADGQASTGFVHVGALIPAVWKKLEAICEHKNAVTGVPTGFADLDGMTRGLQPGNLILVAGRPSMGKTSWAMNVAEHVAMEIREPVGVFSLEQSSEELMMRSLASGARIDSHRMQSGYLGERDWARLSAAIGRLGDAKLHIDDTANLGVFEMRARARRMKAEYGLAVLIIDYIQLMVSHDKKQENRTLELGAISRGLKILARELAIPVVVLSQLSRQPELRNDHRPILSDLRESGALEQDADVVIFLYRDEYYHPHGTYPDGTSNAGIAEAIVSKQRNGPLGTVKLTFTREYTRFDNYARPDEAEDRRLPMGDR